IAVVQSLLDTYRGTPMGACAEARLQELKLALLPPPSAAKPDPAPAPPAVKPAPAPAPTPAVDTFPTVPQPLPSGPVRIGVAGPMTGPNALFGAQMRRGVQQAALDINAKGGINGQKVELIWGDDASDPKQGVSIARSFVGNGIKFVIGHFNSGVTIPASDVYAENGIMMITPSATNPQVTTRGLWNVFRTCGDEANQGRTAATFIAEKYRGERVAIVHDKTIYGKGMADFTGQYGKTLGVNVVLYEGINVGEKNLSALVSRIKASGADLVYWGGLHTEGGLLVRQMREQAVKATLMGTDGMASDEFAVIAGPAAEGTLMTYPPDPRRHPAARAVEAKVQAQNFNP